LEILQGVEEGHRVGKVILFFNRGSKLLPW